MFTKNTNDFTPTLESEFESVTNKRIEIINEISVVQERILLQKSKDFKGILTLKWLNENLNLIIDKVNEYVAGNEESNGYQMDNIERIENLVSKGNGFYSFDIFNVEDGIETQWYVEVNYTNNELQVDDITICV